MTIVDKSEPQTRLQVCAKSLLHWLNFFRKDIYIYIYIHSTQLKYISNILRSGENIKQW